MKLSPTALLEHSRSVEGRKQIRYAGISIVFVPVGQILIQLFAHFVFNVSAAARAAGHDTAFTKASIASAAVLTLPNFFANKFFVWKDPPTFNKIDELTAAKWKRMKIEPSDVCSDLDFLRRVYADPRDITLETTQAHEPGKWSPDASALLSSTMLELTVLGGLILVMVLCIYMLRRSAPGHTR